jgi:chromosome segregation ATPase
MAQPEPIEALHKLLTERKHLSEKIGEVQVSLSHVKKQISESLVQQYVTTTTEKVAIKEDLMRDEQSYERLLQALRDMHKEIEERIRPVEEQIVQAEADHLKGQFEQRQNALADCLGKIDQKILDCQSHLAESHRIHGDMNKLNEQLARLGSGALPVPDLVPVGSLPDLIMRRIENLRSQGKL